MTAIRPLPTDGPSEADKRAVAESGLSVFWCVREDELKPFVSLETCRTAVDGLRRIAVREQALGCRIIAQDTLRRLGIDFEEDRGREIL